MHENGLSERSCKFLIDKDLLQKFIPYKYVVHSPKAQDDKDRYERIQGYYPNPNRCLKVDLTMMKRLRGYKGKYYTILYRWRRVYPSLSGYGPQNMKNPGLAYLTLLNTV